MGTALRIQKALSQPIFLLDAGFKKCEESGGDFWAFKVEGFSGKLYKIHLRSGKGAKCSCPDFTGRHRYCKHILFIFCRILQKTEWAVVLLDLPGAPSSHRILEEPRFANFNQLMGAALCGRVPPPDDDSSDVDEAERRRIKAEEEAEKFKPRETDGFGCPICFEEIEPKDAWVCCGPNGCMNQVHQGCMTRALRYKRAARFSSSAPVPCPLCRNLWYTIEFANDQKKRGAGSAFGIPVDDGKSKLRRVSIAEVHGREMQIQ